MITESVKAEKKERTEKAKNVQGKGKTVNDPELVAEWNDVKKDKNTTVDNTLVENIDPDYLRQMQVLAGTKKSDE